MVCFVAMLGIVMIRLVFVFHFVVQRLVPMKRIILTAVTTTVTRAVAVTPIDGRRLNVNSRRRKKGRRGKDDAESTMTPVVMMAVAK